MNPPNVLTLSRFALAALLMALLFTVFPGSKTLALAVFVLAGITDALDGRLARRVYGTTSFGSLFDPLADKVLVSAAFISFVELGLIPAWMVVLIIAREFFVTGLRLLAGQEGRVISAGAWGKHKTVWQMVAISVILLGLALGQDILPRWPLLPPARLAAALPRVAYVVTGLAALITVVSGAVYFREHRALFTRQARAGTS